MWTPIFSHNDEAHGADSFVGALRAGVGAIEVDTWLWDGRLLAAHEEHETAANRTLKDLYLDPLLGILDTRVSQPWIYGDGKEVMLAIDVKNDAAGQFEHLSVLLQPFLDKGYLTTFDTAQGTWHHGPLIVVGTGDTSLALVLEQKLRFIFLDAPLLGLPTASGISIDNTVAPMASGRFQPSWLALVCKDISVNPAEWTEEWFADLGDEFVARMTDEAWSMLVGQMRHYASQAREKGIKSRWWGVPRPREAAGRLRLLEMQREAGVDWFSGDDLEEMTKWWRGVAK